MNHEVHMRRAIEIAAANPKAPFGAVLLDMPKAEIVAEGLNDSSSNPTLHGEIDAINRYAESSQGRWEHLRLYTTAEPCCMCQAAVLWAGIPEVVFGTSIQSLVAFGWKQIDTTAEQVAAAAPFAECKITGGVLADECDALFRAAS